MPHLGHLGEGFQKSPHPGGFGFLVIHGREGAVGNSNPWHSGGAPQQTAGRFCICQPVANMGSRRGGPAGTGKEPSTTATCRQLVPTRPQARLQAQVIVVGRFFRVTRKGLERRRHFHTKEGVNGGADFVRGRWAGMTAVKGFLGGREWVFDLGRYNA